MADLKNSPDEKAVYAAAEKAIQAVRSVAEAVVVDIQTAAKALRELPERASDLLSQAEFAWASEFESTGLSLELFRVEISIGQHRVLLKRDEGSSRQMLKNETHYRVVVVLFPVKK